MSKLFKRTKILATIGPSVFTEEKITELINAGVNGCRLNFSHGDYAERDQQISWIRAAAAKRGKSVSIVQDLQGPKIRLGMLKDNHLDLKTGDRLTLDHALETHDGGLTVPIQYNLAEKVKIGEPVFLFDGKIRTHVVDLPSATAITVEIENDGFIMSKKGLNLPDTDFGGDIITEKDMADIEFGASRDFDYVALSFIQSAEDIEKLRQILLSHGSTAQIIAKIETKRAIENNEVMEAIVEATDGIMVARGDMAVEAGAEVVPIAQRKLIELCRKHGKIVIVATQMMASMVDNPEPTRAEVSDVATAVILGADAVMLSDETANGKYPVETVKTMKKVILYTQNNSKTAPIPRENKDDSHKTLHAVAHAAVNLAEQISADVLICETSTGLTAANIAAARPNLPIISVTDNPRVAGQLALTYANSSYVRPYSDSYGLDLAHELKSTGYLQIKENEESLTVVIVSGRTRGLVGGVDTIQIRKI
jgi:pyruvate kinase